MGRQEQIRPHANSAMLWIAVSDGWQGGRVRENERPHNAAHFAVGVVVSAGEDDAFVEADHAGDASYGGDPVVRLDARCDGSWNREGEDWGLTSLQCQR